MISGIVSPDREAVIRLTIQGPSGQELEIAAVIDTGFTGELTLPRDVIQTLGLPWLTQGKTLLGNGQIETVEIYAATVLWDGQPVRVMVEEAEIDPLVGMALSYGYEICISNVDGGSVLIRNLTPR